MKLTEKVRAIFREYGRQGGRPVEMYSRRTLAKRAREAREKAAMQQAIARATKNKAYPKEGAA